MGKPSKRKPRIAAYNTRIFDSGDSRLPNLPPNLQEHVTDSLSDSSRSEPRINSDSEFDSGSETEVPVSYHKQRNWSRKPTKRKPVSVSKKSRTSQQSSAELLTDSEQNSETLSDIDTSDQIFRDLYYTSDDSSAQIPTGTPQTASDSPAESLKNKLKAAVVNSEQSRHRKRKAHKKANRAYFQSRKSTSAARNSAGWEPGIDILTTDVVLSAPGSAVTITDYSRERYRVLHTEVIPADRVVSEDPKEASEQTGKSSPPPAASELEILLKKRPKWSKVRWINVNGLSWDCIKMISYFYDLHNLAVEDMVDIPQRTKLDIYPGHAFCCFPLLKLIKERKPIEQPLGIFSRCLRKLGIRPFFGFYKRNSKKDYSKPTENSTNHFSVNSEAEKGGNSQQIQPNYTDHYLESLTRSGKRTPVAQEDETILTEYLARTEFMTTLQEWNNPSVQYDRERNVLMEAHRPLGSRRLNVGVEQVSVFITRDNTVISFFEHSAMDVERPIFARLTSRRTILRESEDASVLLQAVLDAVVDLAYPIITAYRQRVAEMELEVLMRASMASTRDMHLMISELSLLKRVITPVVGLVNSLRDYAKISSEELPEPKGIPKGDLKLARGDPKSGMGGDAKGGHRSDWTHRVTQGAGFISDICDLYLADVADHCQEFADDTDIMLYTTGNMIQMVFNTISAESNYSMTQLSLVTVIFLPLSFLTGYFGMNFTDFPSLDNSDLHYWVIALPFSAAFIVLVLRQWFLHYVKVVRRMFLQLVSPRMAAPKMRKTKRFRKAHTEPGLRLEEALEG